MDKESVIRNTAEYVRKEMEGEGTGHDWWHVYRVWRTSTYIAKEEHADLFIVQLGALLHDIADWKFNDEAAGAQVTRKWLASLHVEKEVISSVCQIVQDISFKGAGVTSNISTLEGKIVQDADRLDALGAIGIARAFAYGGYKRREIYNPNIKPERHETFEQYKKGTGSTINHFYEKLLLLKDLMNTETGRRMAEERHRYMEEYLDRFYREWNGKE
ncbi:MAG: HD domain-containing protein [Nanoarchaeota archaeon]